MKQRHYCTSCPRSCGDRNRCGVPFDMLIARTGLHFGEEPCISGTRGSGTVFFSGCNLGCAFCQNAEISQNAPLDTKTFSPQELADTFRALEDLGAHNINLVTAAHYTGGVLAALKLYRPKVPIVYNTSAYESVDTVNRLGEYVSTWLPDLKFFDSGLSARVADAPDYFNVAFDAVAQMRKLAPNDDFDADGMLTRGVLVRHLVLPSHVTDSCKILDALATLSPTPRVSVMSQYVPMGRALQMPDLARKLTTYEYNKVLSRVEELGLDGYMQQRSSATAAYVPEWREYV